MKKNCAILGFEAHARWEDGGGVGVGGGGGGEEARAGVC